jgi:hypothetical protein
MRLVGFMKNGKGTLHEPEELFAASGSIEVVATLEGGVAVIEVNVGEMEPKVKRGRKPKGEEEPQSAATTP